MKVTTILKSCSAILATSLLVFSCKKEKGKEVALESYDYSNKSFVQVYNATLSPSTAKNYIYVDGVPVTGYTPVSGVPLNYGSTFPNTPSNFAIIAGNRAFLIRDTVIGTTQPPMSFAETFEAGKYYTIFMYDTVNTPKQKTVRNDIVFPDDTTSRIRFANFIFTRTAVPNVDLFSVKRNANVFSNVAVTDVTNYVPHPSSRSTAENDTLYVRETGTMNLLATLTGFAPIRKRSYTLIFRGRYQSTTGFTKTLSSFSSN